MEPISQSTVLYYKEHVTAIWVQEIYCNVHQ